MDEAILDVVELIDVLHNFLTLFRYPPKKLNNIIKSTYHHNNHTKRVHENRAQSGKTHGAQGPVRSLSLSLSLARALSLSL